jgi:hypothetical protein
MKFFSLFTMLVFVPVQISLAGYLEGFHAKRVSSHVYVIHGPLELPNENNKGFMNSPAFVVTGNGVVVTDPGSSDIKNMLLKNAKSKH